MHSRNGLALLIALFALAGLAACSGSSESVADDGTATAGASAADANESVLLDEHGLSPFQPRTTETGDTATADVDLPAGDDAGDPAATEEGGPTSSAAVDPVTGELLDAVESADATGDQAAADGPTLRVVASFGRDAESDAYWHILVVYAAGAESRTAQSERVRLHESAEVTLSGKWLSVADKLVVIAIGEDVVALSEIGADRVRKGVEGGELEVSFGRQRNTRPQAGSTTEFERNFDSERMEEHSRAMEEWANEMERRAKEWERQAEQWREQGERWQGQGERYRDQWRQQQDNRNQQREDGERERNGEQGQRDSRRGSDDDAVNAEEGERERLTRDQREALDDLEGVTRELQVLVDVVANDNDLSLKDLKKIGKKASKLARRLNKLEDELPATVDAGDLLADVRDVLADFEDRLEDRAEQLREANESEESSEEQPRERQRGC